MATNINIQNAINSEKKNPKLSWHANRPSLFQFIKQIAVALFGFAYVVALIFTYTTNSPLFADLLKVSVVLTLIAFIALQSK